MGGAMWTPKHRLRRVWCCPTYFDQVIKADRFWPFVNRAIPRVRADALSGGVLLRHLALDCVDDRAT
jgi:hypothetical protein